MRCNQVSINIERFGKFVPKEYPADVQKISVYSDDYNSIYAALWKAYALAINELAEYESIGARTDVYTNEFSRAEYRTMYSALPKSKRDYENDVNLQYYSSELQLCEDRVWVYENGSSILEALKECEDSEVVVAKLKEKFGLNNYQIRKLSQMRFDMMTKAEYDQLKERIEILKATLSSKNGSELYRNAEKRKLQTEISKLKAYFKFMEHYEDIVKRVIEVESTNEVEGILENEFGFTRLQAYEFKYFELNEFSKKEQKLKEEKLRNLEEILRICYDEDKE